MPWPNPNGEPLAAAGASWSHPAPAAPRPASAPKAGDLKGGRWAIDHQRRWSMAHRPRTATRSTMQLGLITARSGGAANTLRGDEGVGEGVDGGQVGRQVVGQAVPGSDGRGRGVGHLRLARVVPYDDLQRQVERAER